MNRFKKWAEHEYSKKQRIIAVVFGGFIFWIVIPFFIIVVSSYIDPVASPSKISLWANKPCHRFVIHCRWLAVC